MTQHQEGSTQFLLLQATPLRPALWMQSCLGLRLVCPDFSLCQCFLSTSVRFLSLSLSTALSTPSPHQAPSELKWNCSLSNFPSFKSQCLPHHYLFIVLTPMGKKMNLFQRKQGRRLKVLFKLSLKTESKKGLRGTIIERLISSQVPSQEKEMTCLPLAKLRSLNIRFLFNKCRFTCSWSNHKLAMPARCQKSQEADSPGELAENIKVTWTEIPHKYCTTIS